MWKCAMEIAQWKKKKLNTQSYLADERQNNDHQQHIESPPF